MFCWGLALNTLPRCQAADDLFPGWQGSKRRFHAA